MPKYVLFRECLINGRPVPAYLVYDKARILNGTTDHLAHATRHTLKQAEREYMRLLPKALRQGYMIGYRRVT